ncbi:hypothetical protein KUTeg_005201 [Tegillarca granosa]|uniref:SUEL-type lectin domain-containing protein n=1 Tax=Tegillarca granosa TaxID=220873 RepID=A0ABQ9FL07_TEGGR|nr:hypothetical protein KUTeg_005201 [Tegillarca granosa]
MSLASRGTIKQQNLITFDSKCPGGQMWEKLNKQQLLGQNFPDSPVVVYRHSDKKVSVPWRHSYFKQGTVTFVILKSMTKSFAMTCTFFTNCYGNGVMTTQIGFMVLSVFLLLPTSVVLTDIKEEIACENFLIKFGCPRNHTVHILTAQYGRQDRNVCIPDSKTCVYEGESGVLNTACNGKEDCVFAVQSSAFGGDKCPGTTKYLVAQYTCVGIV